MQRIVQFLVVFFRALASLPVEIAAALWRFLIALVILVVWLFLLLLTLLRRLFGDRKPESKPHDDCHDLPPHVRRAPDPCLYSQYYRMSQGLSVTWNNPDIWITDPAGALMDSSSLAPDTDYVLHARIHNASFDPALGTKVRCYYRPHSFNDPGVVPVEVGPDGTERTVTLHIGGWSSEIATFNWHTPDVEHAHFCLRVECFHPADRNPDNNLGQENTNVIAVAAGETVTFAAALFNDRDTERRFTLFIDAFAIPKGEAALTLKTLVTPLRRRSRFPTALSNLLVTRDPQKGGLRTGAGRAPQWVRYAYTGFDTVKRVMARGKFPVPEAWGVTLQGEPLARDGIGWVSVAAKGSADVTVSLTVPGGTAPGSRLPLNVTAITPSGAVAGGITAIVEVTS